MRHGLSIALALAVLAASPVWSGVGELTLDRAAVQELLAAALPLTLDAELRGVGSVTLELGRPTGTDFIDGAVETTLPIRIPALGLGTELWLRYAPQIEPLYGTPVLRAVAARVAELDLDLAALMPPATLPRRAEWSIELDGEVGARRLEVTCFVQGIEVGDERLRLDLGMQVDSRPAPPDSPATDHAATGP